MQSLYRYTTRARLEEIVRTKELVFVSPSRWNDSCDGYVYAAMKTEVGRRVVHTALERNLKAEYVAASFNLLDAFDTSVFGLSWTRLSDDMAAWDSYARGDDVLRLEISRDSVLQLEDVGAFDVEYTNAVDLDREIEEIFPGAGQIFNHEKLVCIKRAGLSFEQEVRLLTRPDFLEVERMANAPAGDKMLQGALHSAFADGQIGAEEYHTGLKEISEADKHLATQKAISFVHISDFISSVMFHPRAPGPSNESLAAFCAANGIQYLGRSKLDEVSTLSFGY